MPGDQDLVADAFQILAIAAGILLLMIVEKGKLNFNAIKKNKTVRALPSLLGFVLLFYT